jgi:hypothetical protein
MLDVTEIMRDKILAVEENPIGVDVSHLLRLSIVPGDRRTAAAVESSDFCLARDVTTSGGRSAGHCVGAVSTCAGRAVQTCLNFIVVRTVSVSFAMYPTNTRMTTSVGEARLGTPKGSCHLCDLDEIWQQTGS